MLPADNDQVNGIDDIDGSAFKEMYVHQIIDLRNSIFGEMRKELNVTNHYHIQACNLNKRSVTKENLVGWLETVSIPRLIQHTIIRKCCTYHGVGLQTPRREN
jgi:hypothetical protein